VGREIEKSRRQGKLKVSEEGKKDRTGVGRAWVRQYISKYKGWRD